MITDKVLKINNEEPMHNKKSYTNENDVKIAILETSVGHINQTLERIEKNMEKGFNQLNQKIDGVDERLNQKMEKIEKRMDKIDDRLWQNMAWILGTLGTLIVGIVLTVCRSFHWIG